MVDSKPKLPTTNYKLLVIVGPTASGKSELAMSIAKTCRSEIICADSRTIYKGMNIGTAKPGVEDRKAVKHWGLDLVEPGQKYNVAKFKAYAQDAIADIQRRGKLPIMVGGSGLYVDSVLFDYQFSKAGSERDAQNPRHLQKAGLPQDQIIRTDALIVGLLPPDDVLKKRIAKRAEEMFGKGIINETRDLLQAYPAEAFDSTTGIAYMAVKDLLRGNVTQMQAQQKIIKSEWQYARRQKTWFRRNRYINWFNSSAEAYSWLEKELF